MSGGAQNIFVICGDRLFSGQSDISGPPADVRLQIAKAIAPSLGGYPESGGTTRQDDSPLAKTTNAARELLRSGAPRRAIKMLEGLLKDLPREANARDVFRIKANIGYCHLQLDNRDQALIMLDDAVASAPGDPKTSAVTAFAMTLRGQVEDAVAYAEAGLKTDPDNVELAAQLIESSLQIEDGSVTGILDKIPVALRERERVCLAICHLLRLRGGTNWWAKARASARRFPANAIFVLFAAEADVDEIARTARRDTHRPLTGTERDRLRSAADTLDGIWRGMKGSEVPRRDDGVSALSTAMVAHAILEERESACSSAADLVVHTDHVDLLVNALQVALFFDDNATAGAIAEKLPDDGQAGFLKGVQAFNGGDWSGAARIFASLEIPDEERRFVATVVTLAPLTKTSKPADTTDVEAIAAAKEAAEGDTRSLIIVARVARNRGVPDLADAAFREALALIGATTSYPERIMVASYAHSMGAYDQVVRTLDGHVDTAAWSKELQWLTDGHAGERPARARNIAFFDGLPRDVRRLTSIARAHGSVLIDARREREAERILQRVVDAEPGDVFALLKLVEAQQRQGRATEARHTVIAAREDQLGGPLIHRIQFIRELAGAGAFDRALAYAYGLVRSRPDRGAAALAYVQLLLGNGENIKLPAPSTVATGTWVALRADNGEQDAFLIEEGPPFLGLDVVAPHIERARRLLGLGVGAIFETDSGRFLKRWTVTEIDSGHRRVLKILLDNFGARYPADAEHLRSMSMADGDVQPVLDMIKEQGEAKLEATRQLYVAGPLPLAMAARAVGSDVASLAHHLRLSGFEIDTCGTDPKERESGRRLAAEKRGAGAVLDSYTAIVCAETNALPLVARWFGTVTVAASTLDELDRMAAQMAANRGRSTLTLAWVNGQIVRQNVDDAMIDGHLASLAQVREAIEAHCEVKPVLLPNDLEEEMVTFVRETAREDLDAMFLSAASGTCLLSEDLHLRAMSAALRKVDGLWLQAVIDAAQTAAAIEDAEVVRLLAALAARRHRHLWLDLPTLEIIYRHASIDEFRAICTFLGGRTANMLTHSLLAIRFLRKIWDEPGEDLRRWSFTSAILATLMRGQTRWALWYAFVWRCSEYPEGLRKYLVEWMRGHFLPEYEVAANIPIATRMIHSMVRSALGSVSLDILLSPSGRRASPEIRTSRERSSTEIRRGPRSEPTHDASRKNSRKRQRRRQRNR